MSVPQNKSVFVTVVGWIFVCLFGMGVLVSILQAVMFATLFDTPELRNLPPEVPPLAAFMFRNVMWIILSIWLLTAFGLVSAIGLLMRREWGRRCFIAVMVINVISNLAAAVMQPIFMAPMFEEIDKAAARGAPDMTWFVIAIMIFGALMALAFAALYGWIARKLLSPADRGGVPLTRRRASIDARQTQGGVRHGWQDHQQGHEEDREQDLLGRRTGRDEGARPRTQG